MNDKKKKIGKIFWVFITLIPIAGLFLSVLLPDDYGRYQAIAQDFFVKFWFIAPLIFIVIQALQVVIAPISHYVVGALGGFVFGFFWGGVYNYIGRLIGHITAFSISRRWGRKWMERFVKVEEVERYDKIFSGETDTKKVPIQSLILFLIYFLPLFPDDEISYLVGLSKMSKRLFILANIFGQLGGAFSLALIGSGIETRDPWFWILTIATLAGFPIIWALLKIVQKKKENKTHE